MWAGDQTYKVISPVEAIVEGGGRPEFLPQSVDNDLDEDDDDRVSYSRLKLADVVKEDGRGSSLRQIVAKSCFRLEQFKTKTESWSSCWYLGWRELRVNLGVTVDKAAEQSTYIAFNVFSCQVLLPDSLGCRGRLPRWAYLQHSTDAKGRRRKWIWRRDESGGAWAVVHTSQSTSDGQPLPAVFLG